MLLEHHPAPGTGEGAQTLDLIRAGTGESPRWLRAWPPPQDNPRHAGLELWMAASGYQVVGKPAGWSGWCQDEDG